MLCDFTLCCKSRGQAPKEGIEFKGVNCTNVRPCMLEVKVSATTKHPPCVARPKDWFPSHLLKGPQPNTAGTDLQAVPEKLHILSPDKCVGLSLALPPWCHQTVPQMSSYLRLSQRPLLNVYQYSRRHMNTHIHQDQHCHQPPISRSKLNHPYQDPQPSSR